MTFEKCKLKYFHNYMQLLYAEHGMNKIIIFFHRIILRDRRDEPSKGQEYIHFRKRLQRKLQKEASEIPKSICVLDQPQILNRFKYVRLSVYVVSLVSVLAKAKTHAHNALSPILLF